MMVESTRGFSVLGGVRVSRPVTDRCNYLAGFVKGRVACWVGN